MSCLVLILPSADQVAALRLFQSRDIEIIENCNFVVVPFKYQKTQQQQFALEHSPVFDQAKRKQLVDHLYQILYRYDPPRSTRRDQTRYRQFYSDMIELLQSHIDLIYQTKHRSKMIQTPVSHLIGELDILKPLTEFIEDLHKKFTRTSKRGSIAFSFGISDLFSLFGYPFWNSVFANVLHIHRFHYKLLVATNLWHDIKLVEAINLWNATMEPFLTQTQQRYRVFNEKQLVIDQTFWRAKIVPFFCDFMIAKRSDPGKPTDTWCDFYVGVHPDQRRFDDDPQKWFEGSAWFGKISYRLLLNKEKQALTFDKDKTDNLDYRNSFIDDCRSDGYRY